MSLRIETLLGKNGFSWPLCDFDCTNANPGSPVVYLAGGPGGSGTGTAKGTRFALFMAMREIGDVIAFDQRGTGLSGSIINYDKQWSYPLDKAGTREEMLKVVSQYAHQAAEYWKAQGVDLSAYNTNESADDLDDLRKVLGVEKISLWSISYGTHLALATIKRHQQRIDRVIMAGLEGPDHTVKLPSDQQKLLEKIDTLVKADSELSQEIPDFLSMVKTVLDRLEKQPVTINVSVSNEQMVKITIGSFDLQRVTAWSLTGPWTSKQLPQIYQSLFEGDFSILGSQFLRAKSGRLRAMSAAMDAASGISDKRRTRVETERTQTLLGDAINFPIIAVVEGLGVPDLGPEFRKNVQSNIPALFISGTLDGRTSVSNAQEVLLGFPNGVHLIIDGAGHSDPLFL